MHFSTSAFLFLASFALTAVHSLRITGASANVNPETGERPERQELSSLAASGRPWDLYIQALERFQGVDERDPLSYYQVAGLHGRPYQVWDGAAGDNNRGYCTHGSIIFLPWHRPYLALFEQIVVRHAADIAAEYPNDTRQDYLDAAANLRIPYWDWASLPTLPPSLTEFEVTVNTPTGPRTLDNPLRQYTFTSDLRLQDFPANEGFRDANATARGAQAQSILDSNAANFRDSTFNLLISQPEYAPFSNNAHEANRGNRFASLEGIHDLVHRAIGGWMDRVPYSAFDPIFFLHHANVDRLFAIWQTIHPDSYVIPQPNRLGTFTNDMGSIEDENTALTPFHSDDATEFYTSITARSTRTFGYTVPELRDWEGSGQEVAGRARAAVQALYGPVAGAAPSIRGRNPIFAPPAGSTRTLSDNAYVVPPQLSNGTGAAPSRSWYANVRVNKFALNEPFFLHFFIGDVPDDPTEWIAGTPSFVGTFAVFSNTFMPVNDFNLTVYGQVPLTRRLIDVFNDGDIADLQIDTMKEYLPSQLKWRAQRSDLTEVSLDELDSLLVFVVSTGPPAADCDCGFTEEEPEVIPDITHDAFGQDPTAAQSNCTG